MNNEEIRIVAQAMRQGRIDAANRKGASDLASIPEEDIAPYVLEALDRYRKENADNQRAHLLPGLAGLAHSEEGN